ncbi:MAG: hypothetical protein VKK42_04295 [Lyngbya sp.]|nr:hypothetical protein [Lyngbya sp.]
MQLIKLIAASLLIPVGLFFLLAIATELINPDASEDSKISVTIAGLTLGLPALGMGGWLLWNGYYQSRQKIENRSRRIHSIFFHLILQNHGTITASHFAQFTQLSRQDAENFIENKALELNAVREENPEGETVYHFPLD